MHIVFDGQLILHRNSLARYTRSLVRGLLTHFSHRVSCVVFSHHSDSEIRASSSWIPDALHLCILPGQEHPYGLSFAARTLRNAQIRSALKRLQTDVYHAHYAGFPLGLSCPLVTSLHDVFQYVPELERGRATGWLKDWLFYRQATLVCDSGHTMEDFLRYVDDSHPDISVAQNGVDECFQATPGPHEREVLQRLGLPSDAPYVLYVGDLTPRKDVPTLIAAFEQALPRLPSGTVLALTSGENPSCPEREQVRSRGLEGKVLFLGSIDEDDLPALYRGASIFAFPSIYEGFGFPPLEAMACGAPVTSTSVSAMAEVLGDAAMTFKPRDVSQLAQNLVTIANDETVRLRLIGRGLARASRFTWERTARAVERVYRRLHYRQG